MTDEILYAWRAWGAVARDGGGVHPGGTVYVATKTDPRVLNDRSVCLGPHEPTPTIVDPVPPEVAAAFE